MEDDDALIEAVLTSGKDEILLATREGMAIHFSEEDVRPMGRAAYGVKGIELEDGRRGGGAGGGLRRRHRAHRDRATATASAPPSRSTALQSRGGKGLINIKTTGRNGPVVGVKFLRGDEGVMLITEKGMIIRLEHGGHLDHRPEHPGRAAHPARGGRPPGLGGPAGGARGGGGRRPAPRRAEPS